MRALPVTRLLLRERVDRDVVEALRLHAVADPVLDPALDLLGAVSLPKPSVSSSSCGGSFDFSSPPQPPTSTAAKSINAKSQEMRAPS